MQLADDDDDDDDDVKLGWVSKNVSRGSRIAFVSLWRLIINIRLLYVQSIGIIIFTVLASPVIY